VFRLTLRNILRRKLRYALTTLAVVLGVAFLSTSFFLTDHIRDTFDELASDIAGQSDLTIRTSVGEGNRTNRLPVPEGVLNFVSSDIVGITAIAPVVFVPQVAPIVVGDDGVAALIPARGPQFGGNHGEGSALSQIYLTAGRDPQWLGSLNEDPALVGEFALDNRSVTINNMVLGEVYSVSSPTGNRDFTLVGQFNFGAPDENKTVGASLSTFEMRTAQEFLNMEGLLTQVDLLLDPGVDASQVMAQVQNGLDQAMEQFLLELPTYSPELQELLAPYFGAILEVVPAETIVDENQQAFDQFVSIISNVLLAFAIIAVVVSTFIINNTFSIVLGQRVRELALLRALGATGRQVSRSVRGEAVIIGTVATIIGLIVGYFLATFLRFLLVVLDFGNLPGALPVRPRTIVVALLVGVGATLGSAIGPSRKVRTIPPVAALRDDVRLTPAGLRRRLQAGGFMTLAGIALLALGMAGDLATRPLLLSLGLGALGTFLGVYLLSPVIARPIADFVGWPIQKLFKVPGRLARENARRSPRRTAATAAALTIGLALVSLAAVVSDSMKATFVGGIDESVRSDLFIYTGNFDPMSGLPDDLALGLRELTQNHPELIDSLVVYRGGLGAMVIEGSTKDVFSADLDHIDDHLDLKLIAGSSASPPVNGATESLLVHVDPADDLDLDIGSLLVAEFPGERSVTFSVGGIFEDSSMLGNWVVDNGTFDRYLPRAIDNSMSVAYNEAAGTEQARFAVETVTNEFPQATVQNSLELRKSVEAQLDQLLAIITVFLGLSLLIAVLGITNTLALSVYERTRELGLLRAVGMTRRQLRRMVRWEAVIIALFGGLLGVAMGVLFGLAAIAAIPETFVDVVSVPVAKLLQYLVVAGVFGLLAAILPARRAARLNVLEAISHH
jgi:putative ABC transport system permease protein